MAIEEIAINNFRNLVHVRLFPSPSVNLIVGKNGSGKTSLLETIYYLGTTRSFRTPHSNYLITEGALEFTLFSKLRKSDVSIGVGIARDKHQIKIRVANHTIKNASQLAELLPVQLINPDVHKLMEDGPRHRRRFVEWGVFHVKPTYHSIWQQCTHILKQRNAALKQSVSSTELSYWDDTLSEFADQINEVRREYLQQLQVCLDGLLTRIPELPGITIELEQGWPDHKTLKESLRDSRHTDLRKGFTHYGPHRADLKIMSGNYRAKDVVSRGQQKLVTALMKIAQLKCLLEARQGSEPVLLVDDLPAELDKDFRQLLLHEISKLSIQCFITGTELTSLPVEGLASDLRVFHVEHGCIDSITSEKV
ncbi:DNA replication/repair protein RecF [Kaarinaea lacus]